MTSFKKRTRPGWAFALLPLAITAHANDLVPVTGVVDVNSGGYGGDDICVVLSSGAAKCYRILVPGDAPDTYFFDSFILNGFVEDFPKLSNIKKFASSFGTNQTRNCAVTTTGQAICWGNPYYLGLGIEKDDNSFPTGKVKFATPVGLESGVASIALGRDHGHACALMTTGEVKCWGPIGPVGAGSNFGQLGIDQLEPDNKPQTVLNVSGASAIALGTDHSCALLNSGTVKCWGLNSSGEMGDGTNKSALTPVDVVNLTDVKAITAGQQHNCALTNAGAVKCWGANESGQLGNGTQERSNVPVDVTGLNSGVVAIAAGRIYTCALLEQSNVKCWGYNSDNQLGNNQHNINYGGGGHMGTMLPVDVIGEDGQGLGGKAVKLVAGRSSTCALMEDSTVKCWGSQGIVAAHSERVGDLTLGSSKVITVMMEKPQTSGTQVSAPTDGLVAYYPFDSDANDASGYGHHGVINHYEGEWTYGVPTFSAGKIGNAARFNGLGGNIVFPTLSPSFGSNDFTINLFLKFNMQNTRNVVLSKRGVCNHSRFLELVVREDVPKYQIYSDFEIDDNDDFSNASTNYRAMKIPGFWTNTWQMVTLIKQGTTISVYIDGQLVEQETTETVMDLTSDAVFGINNSPCSSDLDPFSGKVDELRIYNRALTDTEIQTLMVTPPVTSTLTVTVTKTGSGRVTSDNGIDCGATCLTAVAPNSQMTLSATADSTYQFTGWSGSDVCTGSQNPLTLLVTQTQTCQANFELIPAPSAYPLTVTKTGRGQGTVSSTPAGITCGEDCQETYPSGQVLTLVATPTAGSQFAGWQGDCQGQTAEVSLTMTAAKSCAAQFDIVVPPSYPLAITKTGRGQGTVSSTPAGIACGNDCQETYPSGQVITLVATPAAGSQFAGWQGDCQGKTAEVSLTMTAAKNCAAQFEEMPISPPPLGTGKDCATILATDPSSPSGYYQIDPDGEGNLPPLMTYCDQTTDGGGWTVIDYHLDPTWQSYFTSWRPIEGNTMTIPDTSDNASRTLTQWFKLATPEIAFRRSATCQTVTSANVQGEAYAATGNFYGCTWYNRNCDASCATCTDNYGQQTLGTCPHFEVSGPNTWDAIYNAYSGSCRGDWWNRTPSLGLTGSYCVAYKLPVTIAPPPPPSYPLTVTKTGQGQGTVSSTPAGIACGNDCQKTYTSGQVLTLVATPATGSQFAGWQGDCQGETAEVSLTLTGANSCVAQFEVVALPPLSTSIKQIDGGYYHSCAVTHGGEVKCWGLAGDQGVVFAGTSPTPNDSKTAITINNLSGVVAVATGANYTCALINDGKVKCWGLGFVGGGPTSGLPLDTGRSYNQKILTPTEVPGLTNIVSIAAGFQHFCALDRDGGLWCNKPSGSKIPALVTELGKEVVAVAVAKRFSGSLEPTCVLLKTTGQVKCWGDGSSGELGNGSQKVSYTPVEVTGLSGVKAIAAGDSRFCAITSDSSVKCWGRSYTAVNKWEVQTTPVTVSELNGVSDLVVGYQNACALLETGNVKCWGDNRYALLGLRPVNLSFIAAPSEVPNLEEVIDLSITATIDDGAQICALTTAGEVKCWGASINMNTRRYSDGNPTGVNNYFQTGPVTVIGSTTTVLPPTSSSTSSAVSATVIAIPVAGISSCPTTATQLETSCNAQDQVLSGKVEISTSANIAKPEVTGTVENHGWISNATIQKSGTINGGVLTGYIVNQGILSNFEFVGASLKGGTLAGQIVNNSRVGGWFENVTLAAGTHITGGLLKGQIQGDCKNPAVLEKVRIADGSSLSCVTLGKDVKLGKGVTQKEVKMAE